MKMKDEKQKHNHKLTDLIKVCIFGLLMIAPLLASISQMLYVTLNKNAKDSYYGETINQEKTIIPNTITSGNKYSLNKNVNLTDVTTDTHLYFQVDNVTYIYNDYNFAEVPYYIKIDRLNTTQIIGTFLKEDLTSIGAFYSNETGNKLYLTFDVINVITNTDFYVVKSMFQLFDYNKYSYLDNAFYYGVDQMTQSDLFNWTQNTAIYTGVKAMTDNLQIQTPAIAILIVYWFILTIIYIIIDIVLKCFTTVTHMIYRAD